jgi:hypothetical protein
MSTITAPRRPVKTSNKPELTVSLCIAINHTVYQVEPIRPQDPEITRAWRLAKEGADGAVYDVATHRSHGHQCDCPDFECRRRGLDASGCKHIKALVKMGLLEDPDPALFVEPTRGTRDTAPVVIQPADIFDRPEWVAAQVAAQVGSPRPHVPDEFDAHSDSDSAVMASIMADEPEIAAVVAEMAPASTIVEIPPGVVLTPSDLVDPFIDDDPSSDPSSWPDSADADRWELGPEFEPEPIDEPEDELCLSAPSLNRLLRPFPGGTPALVSVTKPVAPEARLTFPEWIALQASALGSHGTPAARWLAGKLDALADQARALQATTPDEFDARDEVMGREEAFGDDFDPDFDFDHEAELNGYPRD